MSPKVDNFSRYLFGKLYRKSLINFPRLEFGLLLVFTYLLVSNQSYAQSSTSSDVKSLVPRNSMPVSSAQQSSIFGQIRFENLQYMTPLEDAPQLTSSQFLSGRITAASYTRDPGSFNWAADLSAGTFFSLKQSYYSVQEIYMSTPLDENSNLSLGRKKYDWTEIDRIWSFGLWQPRYAIDALRPEDQGLMGLFYDYKKGLIQFLAYGSPIFIPTVGPDIREEDGQLKADNRWYRPPSSEAGNISLSYKIETGDTLKLAQQVSYGAKLRLGEEELGPWIAVAAGYKPVNDILFQRCLRCVSTDSQAQFIVNPRVTHHQVVSADLGYQFEDLRMSVSYYEDQPDEILPPEEYAVQKIFPVKIYSAQVDWNVREIIGRSLSLQLAHIKTVGDRIQDIESDGQDSEVTLFQDRYRFSNAFAIRALGEVATLYSRPLVTKIGYTREFDQEGSILGLEFQYQWDRTWSFLVGVDTLGVDDKDKASSGFINDYRANDRAYAGAFYVF